MKVEDIQIGDWVQNPLGVPYQVLAIHFYKINGDGDGYYGIHLKNKGAEARLEIYDLHPVPLTPEILEKNGFEPYERDNIVHYWKLEEGGVFIIVYNVENDFYVYVHHQKCEIDNAPGYFVHELQHALRLCGIEKEIEI